MCPTSHMGCHHTWSWLKSSLIKISTLVSLIVYSCNTNNSLFHVVKEREIEREQREELFMEKSKSYPEYSCSYTEFGFRERSNSYNFNGPSDKGSSFAASNDSELKRKKRIKSYNVLTVEGKLKSSVRNSFKWIKNKFSDYGVWIVLNHMFSNHSFQGKKLKQIKEEQYFWDVFVR